MNTVLSPYLDRFVLVYLDDILIYSRSISEHMNHLRAVLSALRDAKLYCKLSSACFVQKKLNIWAISLHQRG